MTKNDPVSLPGGNPASPYAILHGCLCSRSENAGGAGVNGKFVVDERCPLHGAENPDSIATVYLKNGETAQVPSSQVKEWMAANADRLESRHVEVRGKRRTG